MASAGEPELPNRAGTLAAMLARVRRGSKPRLAGADQGGDRDITELVGDLLAGVRDAFTGFCPVTPIHA